jgi:hypothetical protein
MLEELLRKASLTVETAGALLRRLSANPWLYGTEVTVTIPAGETFASVRHGLGRGMNGAVVVGATSADVAVSVDLPGADAETTVTVRLAAVQGSDFVVKVRAY